MSKAIAAEKPSIESVGVAGHQPTRQSRKQRRKKLIDAPRQSKCLPKHRPASIITSLGCLVSSRLSRRSHPDCRAIAAAAEEELVAEKLRGELNTLVAEVEQLEREKFNIATLSEQRSDEVSRLAVERDALGSLYLVNPRG